MAVVGNWTYSGDPADSNRDSVRFLVGDTDEAQAKISDEEIAWLLTENGSNLYRTASSAALLLSAKFSDRTQKTVGDLSKSAGQQASRYKELAQELWDKASSPSHTTITAYAGGISESDKQTQDQDTDWDKPFFQRRMHDIPGTNYWRGESSLSSTST